MTTDTLFQPTDDIQIDESKDYLQELVGENKKFKTPQDLAKGKFYADQTVELYKKRMDEMRQDILALRQDNTAKANLQDLIDQIKKEQMPPIPPQNPGSEGSQPQQIKPEDIEALVSRKLSEQEATKRDTENFRQVQVKLQEQFGTNYANVLKQRSEELGLSVEDINSLAKKSPKAFFRTLGLEGNNNQSGYINPLSSTQRTDTFQPQAEEKRTWSYYKNLKKENPLYYLDARIGAQMAQDAVALGEAFKDGDYYKSKLHEPHDEL